VKIYIKRVVAIKQMSKFSSRIMTGSVRCAITKVGLGTLRLTAQFLIGVPRMVTLVPDVYDMRLSFLIFTFQQIHVKSN